MRSQIAKRIVGLLAIVLAGPLVARAAIIQTFAGTGDFRTPGSNAQTARTQFLASLTSVTTGDFTDISANTDLNPGIGTINMDFQAYLAGVGDLQDNSFGPFRADANLGNGFILGSDGLNLTNSGLTAGSFGTTIGEDTAAGRNARVAPGYTANRGGVVGFAPISGVDRDDSDGVPTGYALQTNQNAIGVSIGDTDVGPVTLYFFNTAGNFVSSLSQPIDTTTGRAYVGVYSDEPLGAVLLRGLNGDVAGFQLFEFAVVPEPAGLGVLCLGGLLAMKRRHR